MLILVYILAEKIRYSQNSQHRHRTDTQDTGTIPTLRCHCWVKSLIPMFWIHLP